MIQTEWTGQNWKCQLWSRGRSPAANLFLYVCMLEPPVAPLCGSTWVKSQVSIAAVCVHCPTYVYKSLSNNWNTSNTSSSSPSYIYLQYSRENAILERLSKRPGWFTAPQRLFVCWTCSVENFILNYSSSEVCRAEIASHLPKLSSPAIASSPNHKWLSISVHIQSFPASHTFRDDSRITLLLAEGGGQCDEFFERQSVISERPSTHELRRLKRRGDLENCYRYPSTPLPRKLWKSQTQITQAQFKPFHWQTPTQKERESWEWTFLQSKDLNRQHTPKKNMYYVEWTVLKLDQLWNKDIGKIGKRTSETNIKICSLTQRECKAKRIMTWY